MKKLGLDLTLFFDIIFLRRRILEQNEPYKLEILENIKTEPISLYHIGDKWWDLCAGPHVENTGNLDSSAINLESVAGAYWKGDEKNVMLQVIAKNFGLIFLENLWHCLGKFGTT